MKTLRNFWTGASLLSLQTATAAGLAVAFATTSVYQNDILQSTSDTADKIHSDTVWRLRQNYASATFPIQHNDKNLLMAFTRYSNFNGTDDQGYDYTCVIKTHGYRIPFTHSAIAGAVYNCAKDGGSAYAAITSQNPSYSYMH